MELESGEPFAVPFLEREITEDVVFCDDRDDSDDVKRSLIEHDGYPPDIVVRLHDSDD